MNTIKLMFLVALTAFCVTLLFGLFLILMGELSIISRGDIDSILNVMVGIAAIILIFTSTSLITGVGVTDK